MNSTRYLLFFVIALLAGCAVQVKTYEKPQVDYAKYESWCWMQGCDVQFQGPDYYQDKRVMEEIANAVAWNMYDKGYTQGDDNSDLVVNYYLVLEQDSAEVTENVYYQTVEGEREWLPKVYPEYQKFLKGSLAIDVVDRKSSELIWTTTAVRYLEINPVYDKKSIWNGVGKAMKKFPARQQ